ncbi:heme-binding protein 2-like isoform X1 [Neltuma alba]|uniref:heme-binding protein 2-like isoform X1 n=1 Tax=Neltuma alba TaxID=207710 RepID=UPI0010A4B692|nr:heme-binding protein 2-like isoform X1 [Prosopis alba]
MALCNLSGKTKLASAIEGPRYKVVRSESDFEVRLYDESSWMSASVRGSSFNLSTASGFHRIYQYIHGANLNSSHLSFTAPVLTSTVSSSSSGNADYTVRFYISPKYKGNPPQPNPELKLHLDKWNSHCVAVRKFSGFAGDNNIDEEVKALVSSINKRWPPENSAAIQDKGSYSIAQYNGSDTASGRLNEAWINISGAIVGGCPPSQ